MKALLGGSRENIGVKEEIVSYIRNIELFEDVALAVGGSKETSLSEQGEIYILGVTVQATSSAGTPVMHIDIVRGDTNQPIFSSLRSDILQDTFGGTAIFHKVIKYTSSDVVFDIKFDPPLLSKQTSVIIFNDSDTVDIDEWRILILYAVKG